MSLVIDVFMAFLLGVVGFLMVPLVARIGLDSDRSKAVGGQYVSMAMAILQRALLIKRQHGGYLLKSTSFDPTVGAEKTTINGETKKFKDPHGFMSRLCNYPFGIAHEKRDVIVNPIVADLGRRYERLKSNGEWKVDVGETTYRKAYFAIEPVTELVNIDHVIGVIQGSADPGAADRTDVYTEKSQILFRKPNRVDYLVWLAFLGGGFGLMYLGNTVGGDGGGGSSIISFAIAGGMF